MPDRPKGAKLHRKVTRTRGGITSRKTARNGTALHAALGVAVALACLVGLCPAHAQEWPAKDITLIVNTTPGGGLDVVARATAPFIEKHLPQKG